MLHHWHFLSPISSHDPSQSMEFINENMFALRIWSKGFYILEIVTDAGSTTPPSIHQLHELSFFDRVSEIHWNFNASRMVVVQDRNTLISVLIPHDKTLTPTFTDLGKRRYPPNSNASVLGISTLMLFGKWDDFAHIILEPYDSGLARENPSKRSFISVQAPDLDPALIPLAFN